MQEDFDPEEPSVSKPMKVVRKTDAYYSSGPVRAGKSDGSSELEVWKERVDQRYQDRPSNSFINSFAESDQTLNLTIQCIE